MSGSGDGDGGVSSEEEFMIWWCLIIWFVIGVHGKEEIVTVAPTQQSPECLE